MNENTVKIHHRRFAERGDAKITFLIIAVILFAVFHAAYNYIPVAYPGESFKQEMETAVVQGMSLANNRINPVDVIKNRLTRTAVEFQLPPALIDVK